MESPVLFAEKTTQVTRLRFRRLCIVGRLNRQGSLLAAGKLGLQMSRTSNRITSSEPSKTGKTCAIP
jgi:hypothetical protein